MNRVRIPKAFTEVEIARELDRTSKEVDANYAILGVHIQNLKDPDSPPDFARIYELISEIQIDIEDHENLRKGKEILKQGENDG